MEFALHLNRRPGVPSYLLLSEAICKAIESGQLSPGQQLPSARELAASHCLSLATVMRALEQLKCQGFIETRAKSGAFVRARTGQPAPAKGAGTTVSGLLKEQCRTAPELLAQCRPAPEPRFSEYGKRLSSRSLLAMHDTATLYTPALETLPLAMWQKMLIKNRGCYLEPFFLDYGADPYGYVPLRQAVSSYLARGRTLNAPADSIVVTSYSRLDFFCRVLINPGDRVAVEDPCYPAARVILASYGAHLHPISVDGDGMQVDELLNLEEPVKLVYLTPTHNDPKGSVLSLERRTRLVEWASQTNTLIWENDFDSHLRYTSSPLPTLYELASGEFVIYVTSFWMTLGALVKLGFMVVPDRFRQTIRSALSLAHVDVSPLEASALTDFINEGHLEKCIHRNRITYRKRRQRLLSALMREFGSLIQIGKESCGFHLLVRFQSDLAEETILKCANTSGLPLASSAPYYMIDPVPNEFLVPFMDLTDDLDDRAKAFAGCLAGSCK